MRRRKDGVGKAPHRWVDVAAARQDGRPDDRPRRRLVEPSEQQLGGTRPRDGVGVSHDHRVDVRTQGRDAAIDACAEAQVATRDEQRD